MSLIVYLLFITQIIFLSIAEPVDDGQDVGTVEIHKGRPIVLNPGRFPFVVHLDIKGENRHGYCGGTLIRREVVLSAAHCVKKMIKPQITAWLGVVETYLEEGLGQEIPVRGFTVHDNYIESSTHFRSLNDIALLWLLRPATLNGKTVRLATLAPEDFRAAGKLGYIVGWGIRSCGRQTTMLQQALVRAVPAQECQQYYKRKIMPGTYICIISDDRKKTSTHGDSGSPLVIDGQVVGITSFGTVLTINNQDMCDASVPAVYTYVPRFIPWINQGLSEGPETVIIKRPSKVVVTRPPVPPRKSTPRPPLQSKLY